MAKGRIYRRRVRHSRKSRHLTKARHSRKTRVKKKIRRSLRRTAGMLGYLGNINVPVKTMITDLNIAFPYDQNIKLLFSKREDYDDFITDVALAQNYSQSNYIFHGKTKMINETKEDLEQLAQAYVKEGLMEKNIPEPVVNNILKMSTPVISVLPNMQYLFNTAN